MVQRVLVLFFPCFIETAHKSVLAGNNAELIALAADRVRQIVNQKSIFHPEKVEIRRVAHLCGICLIRIRHMQADLVFSREFHGNVIRVLRKGCDGCRFLCRIIILLRIELCCGRIIIAHAEIFQ